MTNVHIYKRVQAPYQAFTNRYDAGRELLDVLKESPKEDVVVLAAPRGGIPVGEPIAQSFNAPLEPILIRKLPIPYSPEMGFGAVALDGSVVYNEPVMKQFQIPESKIQKIIDEVLDEVKRRAEKYRNTVEMPELHQKNVYLIDDGLATGFTMIAAAKMVANYKPNSIILAVPVSPTGSIRRIKEYVSEVRCLIAQTGDSFAVASYYNDFHDMSDEEVIEILHRNRVHA